MSFRKYILKSNKLHDHTNIYNNIGVLYDMVSSINELLEEKNIITENEWKECKQKSWMRYVLYNIIILL